MMGSRLGAGDLTFAGAVQNTEALFSTARKSREMCLTNPAVYHSELC
jgi:hypothetical protein